MRPVEKDSMYTGTSTEPVMSQFSLKALIQAKIQTSEAIPVENQYGASTAKRGEPVKRQLVSTGPAILATGSGVNQYPRRGEECLFDSLIKNGVRENQATFSLAGTIGRELPRRCGGCPFWRHKAGYGWWCGVCKRDGRRVAWRDTCHREYRL